ncbi:hypothetical protein [Brevundimonas aurantiaca]|uniref:hypothetical protein n=1 Tax=Brevundimonas aurantiaca TaxID=74316 RepID=UPI001D1895D0|nr:hypothetical protein [Brevundimonas aurantiaca]MCC4293841.1 hypothetical protein [Brevundimonas aurantiaca]
MKFRDRNMRALAEMVIGDAEYFTYRSSSYITHFFEECDLEYVHDGSTRWSWAVGVLTDLLAEPSPSSSILPNNFSRVLRVLLDKRDPSEGDEDRSLALAAMNIPLKREGFEVFYDENGIAQFRHVATRTISEVINPHRPFTPSELKKREQLTAYLGKCSEDELIEEVLLPLFRQLGFHRITAAGHKDKSLEYGKDVWMRFTLPTLHVIYFGLQAKKGKLDSSGVSKDGNANMAEIYNQVLMMLGHEIFDPEVNRKVLVDHALIVAGGEITKAARNWLGGKLDQNKRSQIMFMDRDDILNLYVTSSLPLPLGALPPPPTTQTGAWDDIPF